ncbi:MAG: sulfite exporter TauE/SafE family protein [Christiangramia sp.]|uniref:sulfite exporter TauE/SafE family protein n=1 Tax=Christiangramia sp. TaxID=1931228 RepID=UPI003241FC47
MLLSAVILGIFGSLHCVGMCGPIAFLLPLDRRHPAKKLLQTGLYHLGRLLSYASIGLLVGLLGSGFALFGVQQELSIAVGVIMLIFVLIPKLNPDRMQFNGKLWSLAGNIRNKLGQELKKKKPETFFLVGVLNGLLPCGLVYMAVFGAIATASLLESSLYMMLFGIGTIPLMTTAIWLGTILNQNLRKRLVRLIPIMTFAVACWFIVRGLGLEIPFLSPGENVAVQQVGAAINCH